MDEGGRVSRLFCFGLGYTAEALARRLDAKGWNIAGTARDAANIDRLAARGYEMAQFGGEPNNTALPKLLAGSTHLLLSIPPGPDGDPALQHYRDQIAALTSLVWVGYLSTVGVYGDHAGAYVDEITPVSPNSARTKARVAAESAWLDFVSEIGCPVHVFRLAGIYGPGRSAFDKLATGTARRIVKPGQVFNRIHVEDIAAVLQASMARPRAGAIYNVADDAPAPPEEVVTYAAELLGLPPPPEVSFADAELTPMARSFYGESRRVSNRLIKSELGVRLAYPTYRNGLQALLPLVAQEEGSPRT
jgi:dTDP-4-dehydrorhamnose reductase